VLVTVNGARGTVEATAERDAAGPGEAAVIGGAHLSFLATDGGFAAFQAPCFARSKLASPYTLRDAVLLVFTALVDGGVTSYGRWGCLAKADGGAKCEKSDAK